MLRKRSRFHKEAYTIYSIIITYCFKKLIYNDGLSFKTARRYRSTHNPAYKLKPLIAGILQTGFHLRSPVCGERTVDIIFLFIDYLYSTFHAVINLIGSHQNAVNLIHTCFRKLHKRLSFKVLDGFTGQSRHKYR